MPKEYKSDRAHWTDTKIKAVHNFASEGTGTASSTSEQNSKVSFQKIQPVKRSKTMIFDWSSKTPKNNTASGLSSLNILSTCERQVCLKLGLPYFWALKKIGPRKGDELAKLITRSLYSSKKSIRKARTTTSTLEEAHTDASVPPPCPQPPFSSRVTGIDDLLDVVDNGRRGFNCKEILVIPTRSSRFSTKLTLLGVGRRCCTKGRNFWAQQMSRTVILIFNEGEGVAN